MAGRFEPGVRYTEKEVNEIIQRHHEDYSLFRRAMVDARLMDREVGICRLREEQPAAVS